jgi:hypothetical protein
MTKTDHGGGIYFGFCLPIATVTCAEGFTERQTALGRIKQCRRQAVPVRSSASPEQCRPGTALHLLELLVRAAALKPPVGPERGFRNIGLSLDERFFAETVTA